MRRLPYPTEPVKVPRFFAIQAERFPRCRRVATLRRPVAEFATVEAVNVRRRGVGTPRDGGHKPISIVIGPFNECQELGVTLPVGHEVDTRPNGIQHDGEVVGIRPREWRPRGAKQELKPDFEESIREAPVAAETLQAPGDTEILSV